MPDSYQDVIAQCIENQIEIERKAQAWDQLVALLDRYSGGSVRVDDLKALVHPAQSSSS